MSRITSNIGNAVHRPASLRAMAIAIVAACASIPAIAGAQTEEVIAVPGFADFITIDGDSVWVTNRGRVERWSRKGKLAEVAMTRPCGTMAISDGSLWVADCTDKTLNRIDTSTGKKIAAIATGIANPLGELNVVAGAGSIWVASDDKGVLVRIDPASNKVTASIPVDPGTHYLAFGFGSVWAVSAKQQTLQRVDPQTNSVTGKTPVGKEPGFLAAGEGAVWVQEQGDGTVARIDPANGTVSGRVKVGDNLKYGDIDTGGGKVWLRTTADQTFAVIDPGTMTVTARLGKAAGSGALRYMDAGVWTTAHDIHSMSWWDSPAKIGQ